MEVIQLNNGLNVKLNKNDSTAVIIESPEVSGDLFIPRSITKKKNYIITSIEQNAFTESRLQSIRFAENSQLKHIGSYVFYLSSIKSLSIPAKVDQIDDGFAFLAFKLTEISISPKNDNYSYLNGEILVGRSNRKSPNYDTVLFVRPDIEKVSIPTIISRISWGTFSNFKNLKTVIFSADSNLERISKEMFSNSSIENITIPSSVTVIEESAFCGCFELKTVEFQLNSNLKSIEKNAFKNSSIEQIEIPSNVRTVGENSFCGCRLLKTVIFENNSELCSIMTSAFESTGIEKITIPPKVTEIDSNAFSSCGNLQLIEFSSLNQSSLYERMKFLYRRKKIAFISSEMEKVKSIKYSPKKIFNSSAVSNLISTVKIPSSMTQINEFAFANWTGLEVVEFENDSQLKCIGKYAFMATSIESISIPPSVTEIQKGSFCYCQKLKRIDFHPEIDLQFIDESTFYNSSIETILIPKSVTRIKKEAFSRCKDFKSIEFVKDSQLNSIENEAFAGTNLTYLFIPSLVEKLDDDWCYKMPYLVDVEVSSDNSTFFVMNSNIVIGKSDLLNDQYDTIFFACRDIKEAIIPNYIKRINNYAFSECTELTSVEFECDSNLCFIGKESFYESSIKRLLIPQTVIQICEGAFKKCKHLKTAAFEEDTHLDSISKEMFAESSIESFLIPTSIIIIEKNAFSFCTRLRSIEFESNLNLKTISSYALSHASISHISIPSSVSVIEEDAFDQCDNLNTVEFPDDTEISTLNQCLNNSGIRSAVFPSQIKNITFNCLKRMRNIEFLDDGKIVLVKNCFYKCFVLKIISFPNATEISLPDEFYFIGYEVLSLIAFTVANANVFMEKKENIDDFYD